VTDRSETAPLLFVTGIDAQRQPGAAPRLTLRVSRLNHQCVTMSSLAKCEQLIRPHLAQA